MTWNLKVSIRRDDSDEKCDTKEESSLSYLSFSSFSESLNENKEGERVESGSKET